MFYPIFGRRQSLLPFISSAFSSLLQDRSPGERFFSRPPRYSHLRVFGCTCYVLFSHQERAKLSAQSAPCVFLSYSLEHKDYQCYDPSARRMLISRDISFIEDRPFFSPSTSSFGIQSSSLADVGIFLSIPPSPPSPALLPSPPPAKSTSHSSPPPVQVLPLHYVRHPPELPTAPLCPASSSETPLDDLPTCRYPAHEHAPDRLNLAAPQPFDMQAFLASLCSHREPSSYREAASIPE